MLMAWTIFETFVANTYCHFVLKQFTHKHEYLIKYIYRHIFLTGIYEQQAYVPEGPSPSGAANHSTHCQTYHKSASISRLAQCTG